MLKNKIHIFNSPQKTAEAVAEFISTEVNKQSCFFSMAVSGGSTPKLLFETLAKEYKQIIPWEKLKIFWVDERCVSPTDKESNFGMTNEALLQYVLIPPENIFRIKGENPPQDEAKRYAEALEEHLPKKNNLPQFDLVLLGMGDDGHTASIFPDNLSLLNAEETVAVATHPTTRQKRITLTGKIICNAGNIIFLITGKSKSAVLKEILTGENAEKYPTYHILHDTEAEIYADKEAWNIDL